MADIKIKRTNKKLGKNDNAPKKGKTRTGDTVGTGYANSSLGFAPGFAIPIVFAPGRERLKYTVFHW